MLSLYILLRARVCLSQISDLGSIAWQYNVIGVHDHGKPFCSGWQGYTLAYKAQRKIGTAMPTFVRPHFGEGGGGGVIVRVAPSGPCCSCSSTYVLQKETYQFPARFFSWMLVGRLWALSDSVQRKCMST